MLRRRSAPFFKELPARTPRRRIGRSKRDDGRRSADLPIGSKETVAATGRSGDRRSCRSGCYAGGPRPFSRSCQLEHRAVESEDQNGTTAVGAPISRSARRKRLQQRADLEIGAPAVVDATRAV